MKRTHCRPASRVRRSLLRRLLAASPLLLAAGSLLLAAPAQATPAYNVLHTFNTYADGVHPAPEAALIADSSGNLYGATTAGGTNNNGTIFKVTTSGKITTLHSFTGAAGDGYNPIGALAADSSGNLYGITQYGGASGAGTVYKIAESGSGYTVLHSFTSSNSGPYYPQAGVTLASGILYGATGSGGSNGYGTIYKIKTDGTGYTDLAQLSAAATDKGYNVYAPLVVSGSTVYGVAYQGATNNQGELFSLSTSGSSYTGLYAFNSSGSFSGANPLGLLLGKDGNLYGTTVYGGSSGYGTVFVYKVSSKATNAVYNFTGSTDGGNPHTGLAQDPSSGTLYGRTDSGGSNGYGTQFQTGTSGSFKTLLSLTADEYAGGYASAPILSGGSLYDTAYDGGTSNYGSVYKVTLGSSSARSVVFDFIDGFSDGANPYASKLLAGSDGALHGTTQYYERNTSYGTTYHVTTGGTYTQDVVTGSGHPYGSLLEASDGTYFGTTYDGGIYSAGSVFSFTSGDSGSFEDDYDFGQAAGANLPAGLILGSDGNYYGSSYYGGQHNVGAIFRLTPDGYETVLHSFNGSDGQNPNGELIEDSSGNFYGTTVSGGASNSGTVFKLSSSNKLTTLLSLDGTSLGANPYCTLTLSGGSLYGTARNSGPGGVGTVFSVSTSGSSPRVVYSFPGNGANGSNPFAGVIQGTDGRLYGTTISGGANGYGVVYSLSIRSGSQSVMHSFSNTGIDGYYPYAELVEASNGNFYGTTVNGGAVPSSEPGDSVQGIVFQVQSQLPIVTKFSPTSGTVGSTVTLSGVNLGSATSVTFNGVSATISNNTSTSITVTVPSGATTGPLQVTTSKGSNTPGTFTVLGVPASLTVNPTSVTGGSNSTGTVTLGAPAPSGGSKLHLTSSDSSVATSQTAVTVPAGATSATFPITTSPVSSTTSVTISASAGGVTQTATLTVTSPNLTGLSFSPTSVKGGSANSTGTVTISGKAPSGGTSITLSSNNTSALSVPSSVTVPSGSTSAAFTATSHTVSSSTTVTVSANRSSTTKTATVSVTH